MRIQNHYRFGGFAAVHVRSNTRMDPLPLFRPFRVQPRKGAPIMPGVGRASPPGDQDRGALLPQPIPKPAVLYSVVLRSAAPPVLFKHPRTRGARSGSSQCFTAGGIEELLTALEWDVYRLIRSRLDPFYLLHAGAVVQGGVDPLCPPGGRQEHAGGGAPFPGVPVPLR